MARSNDSESDEALLARFGAGDGRAARLLIARLAPRLHAHLWHMLGDRAEVEDIVQETMLRLWRKAPEWQARGSARVSTWAFRVAGNMALDRLRRAGRSRPLEAAGDPPDPRPGIEERMTEADRHRRLAAAIAELPARQRQALVLRYMDGLANPEIAEIMGISVEAVESLTARARRRLKARLAPDRENVKDG